MRKPRLLDLFAGAGGATRGYQMAGFSVTGVDIQNQPNYCGDSFFRADALTFLEDWGDQFDAIHASPPCQDKSALTAGNRKRPGWTDDHVNLIPATRAGLDAIGVPYVIENVQGSDVRRDLTLCGEMFGLGVLRHRYFELGGWSMPAPPHLPHRGRVRGWRHGVFYDGPYCAVYGDGGGKGSIAEWQQAMGTPWMKTRHEIAESIPPLFTHHIGQQLLAVATAEVAA